MFNILLPQTFCTTLVHFDILMTFTTGDVGDGCGHVIEHCQLKNSELLSL